MNRPPVPAFLLDMPARVLFSDWTVMGPWLAENGKCSPTLLDVANARRLRRRRRPEHGSNDRRRRNGDRPRR